ncbi:PQQ-binding-like beta-propeller repeat protein [Haloarcula nitratireducens]|uniref:PQQ-binding-like beta-propeller repeat protein n=1 Tax=Haloarcula nitratireducens TaxID=2487749 RepID=A0AAW4PJ55_9EURY|nr:PQQ-binding-like beta-propeller repeat protein [Halomicroarcula nitratireducens]MBX0297252.1 PQQ-binding-like beta-propeller repeat protein [Halomicroarcula nitratireducens]
MEKASRRRILQLGGGVGVLALLGIVGNGYLKGSPADTSEPELASPTSPADSTPTPAPLSLSWPQERFDAANTGFDASLSISGLTLSPEWSFYSTEHADSGGPVQRVVTTESRIFTTSPNVNELFAINPSDGSVAWRKPIEHTRGSPTLVDDRVVIGASRIHAFDTASGDVTWTASPAFGTRSTLTESGGMLYGGSSGETKADGGRVYALDGATGTVQWVHRTDARVLSTPAVAAGVVFAATRTGSLLALATDSGDVLWERSLSGGGQGLYSVMVRDKTVLVASDEYRTTVNGETQHTPGFVAAFRTSDGDQRWRVEISDGAMAGLQAQPAVTSTSLIFPIMTRAGYAVRALDLATGERHWQRDIESATFGVVFGESYLYNTNNQLHGLDIQTGAKQWQATVPGIEASATLATCGELLLVMDPEDGIHAFTMDTTSVPTPAATSTPTPMPTATAAPPSTPDPRMPSVTFAYSYDHSNQQLTIQHAGGDAIRDSVTDSLIVERVSANTLTFWASDRFAAHASFPITVGDRLTIAVQPEETIRIAWNSEELKEWPLDEYQVS